MLLRPQYMVEFKITAKKNPVNLIVYSFLCSMLVDFNLPINPAVFHRVVSLVCALKLKEM